MNWIRKAHIVAFQRLLHDDEEGATAVEYGLIIALIAAVIVGVVSILGGEIRDAFQSVVDQLQGVGETE